MFEDYLRRWPRGQFAAIAEANLAKIRATAPVDRTSTAASPRVTDAVLGQDKLGTTNGLEIVNPATVFRPDSPQIMCVFKVEGAGLGTIARSVWIAEDVGKAAPPSYKIYEMSLAIPFGNSGAFSLSRPDKGFPVGSYRLEIYLGEKLAKTLKFGIRKP
ncbi:MAG: hypothetical protein HYR60_24020 [Acidobacteria bacterium]|nr:hypothetical protein [Acidobacteriota bacterium]